MDAAALAPLATSSEPLSSLMMKGHPDGRYAEILVTGPPTAINKLRTAFKDEALVLPSDYTYQRTREAAMQRAMDHQIKQGTMPSTQQIRDFYAEHEPTDGAAFQVYETSLAHSASARDLVAPPIPTDGFDVENVLASLRHLSRAGRYEHTYELGIVTQDPDGLNHSVALLPSFPDMDSTDTIWIIRRLQGRFRAPPLELWSALLPSSTQVQTRAAPTAMPSTSGPSIQTPKVVKKFKTADMSHELPGLTTKREMAPNTDAAIAATPSSTITPQPATASTAPTMPLVGTTFTPAPPTATATPTTTTGSGKIDKSNLHVFPNPSVIGTLSHDDILSGSIHPKDIKLHLILHLALSYDNKALFNRINALYTSLGLPTRGESSITKRVSKAFDVRAKELDPRDENGVKIPIGELRAQFDQYRRENGARARGGDVEEYRFKGRPKALWVAAGPPRRKGKKEEEEQEEEEEEEEQEREEDGDEEEASLALLEEDDVNDEPGEDEEQARPRKRRRLTRFEDESDEEDGSAEEGSLYDDSE